MEKLASVTAKPSQRRRRSIPLLDFFRNGSARRKNSLGDLSDTKLVSQIVYVSQAVTDVTHERLQSLLDRAERFNRKNGIAGFLLYSSGNFLQLIEGPQTPLMHLWKRIKADAAHTNVTILSVSHQIVPHDLRRPGMTGLNVEDVRDIEVVAVVQRMLSTLTSAVQLLELFVQPRVLQHLSDGIDPLTLPSRVSRGTILFFGLAHADALVFNVSTFDMIALLNRYYEICVMMIHSKRGHVMKFIAGDSILAFFPDDSVDLALSAVIDVFRQADAIRKASLPDSVFSHLTIGVGGSYGYILEGNVGSGEKMDYTIIGDAVNVAARLKTAALNANQPHRLLFSGEVFKYGNIPNAMHVGTISVKGREEMVNIFSLRSSIAKWPRSSTISRRVALPPLWSEEDNLVGSHSVKRTLSNKQFEPEQMIRITYISEATSEVSTEQLDDIAEVSSRNNARFKITGLLLMVSNYFMQSRIYERWSMRGVDMNTRQEHVVLSAFRFFLKTMSTAYGVLKRYSQTKLSDLMRQGIDVRQLGLELLPQTIVWTADLVNFTSISERLDLDRVVQMLDVFFDVITNRIEKCGGQVYKFMGDCVLAYFPPSRAADVLTMTFDLLEDLATLREEQCAEKRRKSSSNRSKDRLQERLLYVGVGISQGDVYEGPLGGYHKDFAVVGRPINSALKAEAASRNLNYCVVVTEQFRNSILERQRNQLADSAISAKDDEEREVTETEEEDNSDDNEHDEDQLEEGQKPHRRMRVIATTTPKGKKTKDCHVFDRPFSFVQCSPESSEESPQAKFGSSLTPQQPMQKDDFLPSSQRSKDRKRREKEDTRDPLWAVCAEQTNWDLRQIKEETKKVALELRLPASRKASLPGITYANENDCSFHLLHADAEEEDEKEKRLAAAASAHLQIRDDVVVIPKYVINYCIVAVVSVVVTALLFLRRS